MPTADFAVYYVRPPASHLAWRCGMDHAAPAMPLYFGSGKSIERTADDRYPICLHNPLITRSGQRVSGSMVTADNRHVRIVRIDRADSVTEDLQTNVQSVSWESSV